MTTDKERVPCRDDQRCTVPFEKYSPSWSDTRRIRVKINKLGDIYE